MRSSVLVVAIVTFVTTGCSGPESSLKKAKRALEDKDIATFEEVVDLQSLVPSVVQACASLQKIESTANEMFEKKTTWGELGKGIGEMLGEALVSKMTDQLVLRIRNEFGSIEIEKLEGLQGCGDITLGSLDGIVFETAGKTSRAKIPVLIGEGKSTVALRLEDQGDRGWVIKALELGDVLEVYREHQKQRVEAEAVKLAAQVEADTDLLAFKKLRTYLENASHGSDVVEQQRAVLRATEARIRGATAPLTVEKASYWRSDWSRYATVQVRNPGAREVAEYVVRIEFLDKTGEIIGGSFNNNALMGRDSDGVKPGKTRTGTCSVNQFTWPTDKIRTAEAKVAYVKFIDGEEWTHPAAAAGLWE